MHAELRRRRAPEAIRLRAAHGDHARHRLGRVFRAEGAVLAQEEAEVAAHFFPFSAALATQYSRNDYAIVGVAARAERVVAAKNLYRVPKSPSFAAPPNQQRF